MASIGKKYAFINIYITVSLWPLIWYMILINILFSGQGLQGIAFLKDPIANNLRQYMYLQLLRLGK